MPNNIQKWKKSKMSCPYCGYRFGNISHECVEETDFDTCKQCTRDKATITQKGKTLTPCPIHPQKLYTNTPLTPPTTTIANNPDTIA